MTDFKWRHFAGEVILHGVRWYCKYGISYRDLEEMLAERGIGVDHTTLYRWVQKYAPEIEKRLRWHRRGHELRGSWERINAERAPEPPVQHQDVKYLNNVIEADHGKLKRLIKPMLVFKTMKSAYATLKGFEVMRTFRKGQFAAWYLGEGVMEEVHLINRLFGANVRFGNAVRLKPSVSLRPWTVKL